MSDLFQIIAAHEARQPSAPDPRTTTLTVLGQAAVTARELGRLAAALDTRRERMQVFMIAFEETVRCLELDDPRPV